MCRFRHKVYPMIRFPKYAGCQVNFPKKTKYSTAPDGMKDEAEKNLAVYDWFMRRFGGSEEVVLDLGCGSGGAAVAAAFYGMSSVSIDDRSIWVLFIKQCIHCVSHFHPPQAVHTRSRLSVLSMAIDNIIHPEGGGGNRTMSVTTIQMEGNLFERYDAIEASCEAPPADPLQLEEKWNDDSPCKDSPAGQSPAAHAGQLYWAPSARLPLTFLTPPSTSNAALLSPTPLPISVLSPTPIDDGTSSSDDGIMSMKYDCMSMKHLSM